MFDRGGVGGKELLVIMATSLKAPNLLITPVGDHRSGARIAIKEVLTHIGTGFGFERLIITI